MSRGGGALALGLAALAAAWLFGSTPALVVATGLSAAGLAARVWARSVGRGAAVERSLGRALLVEGDDLRIGVRLVRASRLPAGAVTVEQPLAGLAVERVRLRRSRGEIVVRDVPRGRYVLDPLRVVLSDPLGLEEVRLAAGSAVELLVRPRVPELDAIMGDGALRGAGGARGLLHRSSGFDLHAVRAYEPGEPLRAVHWPSTARRDELMVKELDDAPRDDVVVVLDADTAGVTGARGSSSLDAAVRAAGAIVRANLARGRRTALVVAAPDAQVVRSRSLDRDWPEVLDVLAAVEARPGVSLRATLADPRTPAARSRELVLVTARADAAVDALAARAREGRRAALVLVDAASFAGAAPARPSASALRASAAGVPVVVVRAGDDLRSVLEGAVARRAGA